MKKSIVLAVIVLMLGITAFAQGVLSVGTTSISAVKGESLSISAAALTAFAVLPGDTVSSGGNAVQTLSVTTVWNLKSSRTNVDVCAGSSDLTAPAGNPDIIPMTSVEVGAGTSLNAGAGCNQLSVTKLSTHVANTNLLRKNASGVTDTLQLKLGAIPATIQADTYTGTITVYAWAS